jgi:hypothetical protein
MPGSQQLARASNKAPVAAGLVDAGPPLSTLDDAATALTHAVRHALRRHTLICELHPLHGKPTLWLALAGPLPDGWKVDWLVKALTGVGIAVDDAAAPPADPARGRPQRTKRPAREADTRR